jgi:FkbM family methyltransferase
MSADSLESWIRRLANRCGLDVTRYRPAVTESGRLAAMLAHHGVNLVLDVGANTGQFASNLRRSGYNGRMLSFEPLEEAHARLVSAARGDPHWEVAPRGAIGEQNGEIEIHVSGNSFSSSVLEMLDTHADAAPASRYIASERVRISTLDDSVGSALGLGVVPFLKIDTQGYEEKVLNGAAETLAKVRGVQLELSFVPLYQGQQLFDPLLERLRALGFCVWGIWPGFCDPASGRMLQVDAILFRE